MPFTFLKYLQPTHYFRLKTNYGNTLFPKVELLPASVVTNLNPNNSFQSEVARAYDVSWQAVMRGYVGDVETYDHFEVVSVQDNYGFIRRYFHSAWVFYVLIVRILTFHNPIQEILGWYRTRNSKKININAISISSDTWQDFSSALIANNPKVSVIIPTLNRYDYLHDVLTDFTQQDYLNFEILVIDQSDEFNADFYKEFKLDIRLIRQEEKALWLARNTGVKNASGEFIALSEDDVRIPADWISNHLKCLDFFDCQVSAGVFYPEGKSIPIERSFFAIASQFATGNAMLYKSVFNTVGLFDRQFEKQRMGDGEFGLRVYLEGLKSISNPYASCVDVKAGTGGLREMGSWDAFRPSAIFAPRPIPSVLYYFRKYYGDQAARFALWRTIPISVLPYQFKNNKPLLVLGVLMSILLTPLVLFQVVKSWRLANKKLEEGALIEELSP